MSLYLIDTNILSELMRPQPCAPVCDFVAQLDTAYISTITVHELEYGIARLRDAQRQERLREGMAHWMELYADCILDVSTAIAQTAAQMRAQVQRHGRMLHLADALLSATAKEHGLRLATRNIADLHGLGVALFNPWDDA